MPDLHHEIVVNASPSNVYKALTTSEGLKSWWTGDSVARPEVGSIAEFGFSNRQTLFRMQIDELEARKRVVWTCVGDWDEWKDTRLDWELTDKERKTLVRFTHANWESIDGMFATCNTTWGALMYRLRDYLEGKNPGPLFKGFV